MTQFSLSTLAWRRQIARSTAVGGVQAAAVLLGSLWAVAGSVPAYAQSSGALPIYRCASADGTTSRISRSPCAPGETGAVRQAVAGTSQTQAPIVHQSAQNPSTPVAQSSDDERQRVRSGQRVGKRR